MRNNRKIPDYKETKIFYTGKKAWYCVYSNRIVTRTWLKSFREERISIYLAHGKAQFKAGGKHYTLKHLVATAFLQDYKKGDNVIVKDGNEFNCALNNLEIISKHELGKRTGKKAKIAIALKVIDNAGNKSTYPSVRAAAKSLYCSYQTILNYLSGNVNNSVLTGYKIKKIKSQNK